MCFFSGGYGFVPEFVIADKGKNELINTIFLNTTICSTEVVFEHRVNKNSIMYKECFCLSRNGVFCYDTGFENTHDYNLISKPIHKLSLECLKMDIRNLLFERVINSSYFEKGLLCKKAYLHIEGQ